MALRLITQRESINLLNRVVKERQINLSPELRYFFDLFLKYPDNPINYEVRYGRRLPNDLDGKVIEEYDRTLGNMTWMKILLSDLKHLLIYRKERMQLE